MRLSPRLWSQTKPARLVRRRRLFFEPLESRALLAVILVTRADDAMGIGDGVTLREAIVAANTNASVDGSSAGQAAPEVDVIAFAPEVLGQTITLGQGELTVTDSLTIRGPGADRLAISGGSGQTRSRVFDFGAEGAKTYRLDGVTVKDGNAVGYGHRHGGAIRFIGPDDRVDDRLIVTNSVIRDSTAGEGGGLDARWGALELLNVAIVNNTANYGGGLRLQDADAELTNVTISGNVAVPVFGQNAAQSAGILQTSAPGGISRLRIVNSTITANQSHSAAGAITSFVEPTSFASVTIGNSIVANDLGGTEFKNFGSGATVVSLGNNLSSDASGELTQPGDMQNTDPKLGSLANNGGGTLTHALLSGSPAIHAGSNLHLPDDASDLDGDGNTSETLPLDQRGVWRTIASAVDIGAFEWNLHWHNASHPLNVVVDPCGPGDVACTGLITASDVLAIINYINAFGAGPVPASFPPGFGVPLPYLDVTADGNITSADAVAVVNWMNAFGSGLAGPIGEGEGASFEGATAASDSGQNDFLALLALDIAEQAVRRRRGT